MPDGNVAIWDHIDGWLKKIVQYKAAPDDKGFEVEEAVATRLREILGEICEESSIFPHISSDGENGITAVWHARAYSLQICVWSNLEVWVFVQSPKIPGRAYGFGSKESRDIQEHLRALSTYVNRVNPKWRELVPAAV